MNSNMILPKIITQWKISYLKKKKRREEEIWKLNGKGKNWLREIGEEKKK